MKKLLGIVVCLVTTFAASAQLPKLEYARNFAPDAKFIDVDPLGNSYVTGSLEGNETYGSTNLGSNGERDVFILKLGPTGNILWAKSYGGAGFDEVTDIDVDNSGNIVLAGYFNYTADFDPDPIDEQNFGGGGDAIEGYVLRLDPNGEFVRVSIFGSTQYTAVNGVSFDASLNVYLTGYFSGDADLDPTTGEQLVIATDTDAFFAKLNSDGSFAWAKTVGNSETVSGTGVGVDFTGRPVFTGYFLGESFDIDFDAGTTTLFPTGGQNIFVLRINQSGVFGWGKKIGGSGNINIAHSVHADVQNNIYVAGEFTGSGDFDPGFPIRTLTADENLTDAFVAKFHPAGDLLWAHDFGGDTANDRAAGIWSDGTNVFTTGTFDGNVDFNPGAAEHFEQANNEDIFILKLNGSGLYQWVARIGGSGTEDGRGIAGDPAGNIYTTGQFTTRPLDMDPSGCETTLDPETDPSYVLMFGPSNSACVTITSQPQSQTVCQGTNATFTVAATGINLTYQWYGESTEGEMDVVLTDNSVLSGTQTATLTVNTSTLALGYSRVFQVVVSGDASPAAPSNIVSVSVAAPVEVQSTSRCGPGIVVLKITDSYPAGTQFRWYTDPTGGTPITGVTGSTYTTPALTATTTYYVSRVLPSCESPRAAITATISSCQPIPEFVWAKSIGSNGRLTEMHVDKVTGTVYVAGTFTGTSDFDPGPGTFELSSVGHYDVFIAKYTTAGAFVWAGKISGPTQDDVSGLTVDKDGNILISGYFLDNNADFDPDPVDQFLMSSAGSWDTYIVKLNNDGDFIWAKRYGGTPTLGDISASITTDAAGNIYVAGSYSGTVNVNPTGTAVNVSTLPSNTDGLILKLAPNGDYMNVFELKGPGFERFNDLVVDATGNIYATGYYYRDTDFNPGTGTTLETGSNDQNAFAMKMDATGALVWHKTFSEASTIQHGSAIVLDSEGNVIVSGRFDGTVDLDPGTGTDIRTASDQDSFTVKLDANGNHLWARSLWNNPGSAAQANVDGTDVYIYGGFPGEIAIDLDPGPGTFNMTSAGNADHFITKLNKDGDFQWALQMGGTSLDALTKIAFDNNKNIYTGGMMYESGDYDPGPGFFNVDRAGGGNSGVMVKLGAPSGNSLAITTQPVNTSVCDGAIATLTVAASGATNIQYRWQKFDALANAFVNLADGTTYSGSTTSTLTITTAGNTPAGKYRVRVSGDNATDIFSNEVDLVVVTTLTPPTTTGTTRCGAGVIIVNAAGTTNGNYRWYTSLTGPALTGEVNDSYTAGISATTTYYVSIVSGSCESTKTSVTATVNPIPATPTVTNVSRCTGTTTVLTATGGTAGTYKWYDVATGGTPVSMSDSFTTPTLSATTTYYVTTSTGSCESTRAALTVTVSSCANNQSPAIATTTSSAGLQGTATINLTSLISDPDNNIDLATLRVVGQAKSGAPATIDQNGQLRIDYSGTTFSGEDEVTIEVCDIAGSCAQQVVRIVVTGEVMVYNAVSPNGDGKNDVFYVAYIDVIPETRENKVSIFNRWGAVVFEVENYNNTTNVFKGLNKNGNELPSGTYFYKIVFKEKDPVTGYISLKR